MRRYRMLLFSYSYDVYGNDDEEVPSSFVIVVSIYMSVVGVVDEEPTTAVDWRGNDGVVGRWNAHWMHD